MESVFNSTVAGWRDRTGYLTIYTKDSGQRWTHRLGLQPGRGGDEDGALVAFEARRKWGEGASALVRSVRREWERRWTWVAMTNEGVVCVDHVPVTKLMGQLPSFAPSP